MWEYVWERGVVVSGRQKVVRIEIQIVEKNIFCRKNEFYLEKWDIWQIVLVRACACLCVRVCVCAYVGGCAW